LRDVYQELTRSGVVGEITDPEARAVLDALAQEGSQA
jgi:hypothetical protein